MSHLEVSLTPQLLHDLSRLLEFFQNYSLQNDLKQYRPQRRPMITPPGLQLSEQLKRKKRLLVRDWFFYVIWYIRLKKLLVNYYNGEKTPVAVEDCSRRSEMRVQSVTLKVFEEAVDKYRTKDKKAWPTIELELEAVGYSFEGEPTSKARQLMVKEVKGFAVSLQKRSVSQKVSVLNRTANSSKRMPEAAIKITEPWIPPQPTQLRHYKSENHEPPQWNGTHLHHRAAKQPEAAGGQRTDDESIFTGIKTAWDSIFSVFNTPQAHPPALVDWQPHHPQQPINPF